MYTVYITYMAFCSFGEKGGEKGRKGVPPHISLSFFLKKNIDIDFFSSLLD